MEVYMGSLYQRGNTWWIKYYRQGKCFRETSGSTKKMVAKTLLARREGDIAKGKVPAINFEKVTFDELVQDFIMDYEINEKKSIVRAKASIKHLETVFAGVRVPAITTQKIQGEYIQGRKMWSCQDCDEQFHIGADACCPSCGSKKLLKGAANATINRELAALRRILNLGANQTPPKVDRVPHIPMLKENNIRKGFFEHGQFIALRNVLPDYLKPYVTFGYKIGWRHQELASLTWSDVDLENGILTLKVGETKNKEARTVYLDQELKGMLESQWLNRKKTGKLVPYVFPNQDGTGKITNFRRAWNTACRNTKMGFGYRISVKYALKWEGQLPPGPIFHDLRRTAVRNMVRAGIPERVAMMVSGHKTRSVFDRYNIVNDADLKMASAMQETYLKNQTGTDSGTITELKGKTG
jgi:integrase